MTFGFDPFHRAALTLGLHMEPEDASSSAARIDLDGELLGVRVHVAQWTEKFVQVSFAAYLDPPFDLRLSLQLAGLSSSLRGLVGKKGVKVGDAAFDEAFDVRADEPDRARALLIDEVRASLLALAARGLRLQVTDEAVTLFVQPRPPTTLEAGEIIDHARSSAELATLFGRAMRRVPSSAILAPQIAAWSALAIEQGFELTLSPLRISGKLDGEPFTARAAAVSGSAYGIELKLRFARRMPWNLRIRPAKLFDFLERAGEAPRLEVGARDFDAEMRVTTTSPGQTKAFLDAEVRAALLDLHRGEGGLLLDADGISVRTRGMTDLKELPRIVERVATLTRKLHDRAHGLL